MRARFKALATPLRVLPRVALALFLTAAQVAPRALADVNVATSGAFAEAFHELKPDLERVTEERVMTVATSIGAGEESIPRRLARGEAIDVVGPLPAEVQKTSVFSAGVTARSPNVRAARKLIDALASPGAAHAIALTGLEPIHTH